MTARRQFRRAHALSGVLMSGVLMPGLLMPGLLMSGLLVLGACASPGGPDAPGPAPEATAGPVAETSDATLVPPGPKPTVPAGFAARQPGDAGTIVRPPLPPMRPPFPRVQPAELDGMALERALTLFGKPAEVRRGPLLTTWTYAGVHCDLEIDFHFSVVDNAMRAHDTRILGPADTGLCLHDLALPNAAIAER